MLAKQVLSALIAFAACGLSPATHADSSVSIDAVRGLGVQIKNEVDLTASGRTIDKARLPRLTRQLQHYESAVEQAHDATLLQKLRAISLLLGELAQRSAHPHANLDSMAPASRANVDEEVVTNRHGASCATALGISEALPVRITLAQPGKGRSDAWFRYAPNAADGGVQFVTDSSGMDPSLAVYADCASGTHALATNDDTLGLDATVSLAFAHQLPLLVHLSNSGAAGSVVLSASAANGSLSGQVLAQGTNQPVTSASVNLFFSQSGYLLPGTATTDQNGNFAFPALVAGTYYLRVDAFGFVSQLYQNASCAPNSYTYSLIGCDTASAQPVVVTSGTATAGVDLALSEGFQISGQVEDTTNQPIAGAEVQLLDTNGSQISATYADANGYYTFATLPAGGYKVQASSNYHVSQMFDHVACAGDLQTQCDLADASVVDITNADVNGVNFTLQELAAIHGAVAYDSTPAFPYSTVLVVENTNTHLDTTATADADGNFIAGPLALGTYRIYASAPGYFSQAYDGTDCQTQTCATEFPNAATIAITAFGQQAVADFSLHSLPIISGHVQDASSGLPLANVSILASTSPPRNFSVFGSAVTDQAGNYALMNVPAGRYYLWALSANHVDQIFNGVSCESFDASYTYNPNAVCDVSGATLLTIAPGQTPGAIDFSLARSARVTGSAHLNVGSDSDIAAPNVPIRLYDGTGAQIASATTDALGNYALDDIPAATYFAAVISASSYMSQIWRNQNCNGPCYPTTGTAISVPPATSIDDVDFSLLDLSAVVGRVTDGSGMPLAGSTVDLFSAQNGLHTASSIVNADGFYSVRGVSGFSYFAATDAGPGYVNQVFSGISCPLGPAYYGLCPLDQATSIPLSYYATQPHIVNFVLQHQDDIFANGFE